jgi:acyl-coenzyme A thioesterase PaaI-like protein
VNIDADAPDGFSRWTRRSPFGDAAGPLYHRVDAGRTIFATRVDERHTNASGTAHGGMLATFADLALGYATAFSTEPPTPVRTVAVAIDFIGQVRV